MLTLRVSLYIEPLIRESDNGITFTGNLLYHTTYKKNCRHFVPHLSVVMKIGLEELFFHFLLCLFVSPISDFYILLLYFSIPNVILIIDLFSRLIILNKMEVQYKDTK